MSATIFNYLPRLSEYDPADTSEGSIDPLGLYFIADVLGMNLAPGIRERQSRVRFLTVIAASLHLCLAFDDDQIANDGVSEPWQVFEWYIVEGLVRKKEANPLSGVPGQSKVSTAINQGKTVNAITYLKNASAFGFHGVYRVLARELGIEAGGLLDANGSQLLDAWQTEQDLKNSQTGHPNWCDIWQSAIRDGMKSGEVSRKSGWEGWQFIADHLHPSNIGKLESKLLTDLLTRPAKGYRDKLVHCYKSPEAQNAWKDRGSEREIHNLLLETANGEFKELLLAIQAYEAFSRLLLNAFEDILFTMTQSRRRITVSNLTDKSCIKIAADKIPELYALLTVKLDPYIEISRFIDAFSVFADKLSPTDFAEQLLSHHFQIQKAKPPHGKAPWCERFDDGSYIIRPAYLRNECAINDDRYVHGYRTSTLMTFTNDLGLVV